MAKVTVKVEGLKELDAALGKLTKATARGALRRVLLRAAEPIKNKAQSLAPYKTGELKQRIAVSSKKPKGHDAGKNAFAEAMQSGATRAEAGAALRTARKSNPNAFAEVFVGPTMTRNKQASIKTIVQEFGSVNQPGKPYMRPAWDSEQNTALNIIKNDLGDEIDKTAKRAAARKAAKAAKGR